VPEKDGARILHFLEEAFDTHDVPLDRIIVGEFEDTMRNVFYAGEINGEMVASSWYTVPRNRSDIGVFGEVFTRPEHRGKRIALHLTNICRDDFVAQCGNALYLATENPTAARVYEKAGYEVYTGNVMRFLAKPDPDFDGSLFSNTGQATPRAAVWGDLPKVVALCVYPHRCMLRDYPSRSLSSRHSLQKRCVSLFWPMWKDGEAKGGRFDVLENDDYRVVGLARVVPSEADFERHVGTLDFVVHDSYQAQAAELIKYSVSHGLGNGLNAIRLYIASCDEQKIAAACEAGFQLDGKLPDQLCVESRKFDLQIYSYETRQK
jgi:GNAT superfamily N-acetyltransferase